MDKKIAEVIIGMSHDNLYMKNLGLNIKTIDEGLIIADIKVADHIINPYGSVHGGALYALADIAAGFAACTYGSYVSTVSGNLTYLKPAMNTTTIKCSAKVLHLGRKVTSVGVELTNDNDELLESGTFIFSMLDKKLI